MMSTLLVQILLSSTTCFSFRSTS